MSFDLRVTFHGLCVFVPQDDDRMHVLLPAVNGAMNGNGNGHAVPAPRDEEEAEEIAAEEVDEIAAEEAEELAAEAKAEGDDAPADHEHGNGNGNHEHGGNGALPPHFAAILYDTAYERPGARKLTRTLRCRPLSQVALQWGFRGLPLDSFLPDELADLDAMVGVKIPRSLVAGPPCELLAGRITMTSGGVTDWHHGGYATFADLGSRRLTSQVEWTFRGIEMDSLPEWRLTGVDEHVLHPVGGTIHLSVWNGPREFVPGAPSSEADGASTPPNHFKAYYPLLGLDRTTVPIFEDPQPREFGNTFFLDVGGQGQTVTPGMTCIGAKGSLG